MSRPAVFLRRSMTMLAVVAALAAGLLTIRVAAAWTASEAPLEVSPVSVSTLQLQLDNERARSAALSTQLGRLASESSQLHVALNAAQERIAQDTDHADELSKDLDKANKKLKTLEKAIREARAALARQPAVTVTTVRTVQASTSQSSGGHEDDDHEDHEDHEEHDDD